MAETDEWTIGRLLEWTTDYLKQHGADSPRLDAEVLLASARGCSRIELYTSFREPADDTLRTQFRDLIRRRSEGAPVAYLVGHREFYSLDFKVTPDVLIPRPETELLVVTLLDYIKERDGNAKVNIVDVGTGSGVLAACVAVHAPQVSITAVDISPAALAIATENFATHKVADRVNAVQGDLLSGFPPQPAFDFIVSNPPYVSEAEHAGLAPDVRDHEPKLALVSGPSGTEIIERLIAESAERLRPGGRLLIELSPLIHTQVLALFAADGRFGEVETIKDLARHPRVVTAVVR
jgi:release factor glutamine methyltransferase